ncbi:hypothetical protein [Verrucomicrobium sp. BvORR034]|jgi:hypothetical protein|uniref:hypothetical protein n=1 Tax=Verrucomicrobium sp. BvORR034 TaxID=1396418 RepID=UPI0006791694|nr:hypothetical protein [Verrucomicrobium sp. BvORR034]
MNGKKIACVVLMMILAGITYGSQMLQKRAKAMREESESAEASYANAKMMCEVQENTLIKTKYDNRDLREFLKEWDPELQKVQTGQEAEQALLSIVRNSRILTVSQKFEVKDNRTNPVVPKSLQGTLVVQDDYAKTMNWLAELERRLPLTCISVCRMRQGENGRQLNLEIHFDIPLVNLKADMEVKR